MNTLKQSNINNQRGAASLLTALVLLIGITLITLTTSKTVLNETKIAADNYRATQAVAAANYAMDFGVDYFDNGGFDQVTNAAEPLVSGCTPASPRDCRLDFVAVGNTPNIPNLTSADGNQTTSATLTFNVATGTRCVPAGATPDMKNGMITAQGFSDDNLGTRTITQCVGPIELLKNGGPKQPLVAQGNVAVTGNARIINRYTNTTIWSGGKVKIGSSSAMETFIKDGASGTLTKDELIAAPTTGADPANTQEVSNKDLGNGLDIIDDDPSLGTLIGLDYFKNFFGVSSREELAALAGDQAYTSMGDAISDPPQSGLIWVEEADHDHSLGGNGQIGTPDAPAIVIVNGDLSITGGVTIYGLLYVTGKYTIPGSPQIIGANIVEGTDVATETPSTQPIVSGTGSISLVYWPFASDSEAPLDNLTAVVSGSWRDW